MATLRYPVSMSGETLKEIIPELNRICFESTGMSRGPGCADDPRRSHAARTMGRHPVSLWGRAALLWVSFANEFLALMKVF